MRESRLRAWARSGLGFPGPRLPLRGRGRVWFQGMAKTGPGFPFRPPSFTICIEKAAKHLTTSPTMLTAAKEIGKPERRPDLLGRLSGRLIDYLDMRSRAERLLIHEGLVDTRIGFRRGKKLDHDDARRLASWSRNS